jgi:hypothetical protein
LTKKNTTKPHHKFSPPLTLINQSSDYSDSGSPEKSPWMKSKSELKSILQINTESSESDEDVAI